MPIPLKQLPNSIYETLMTVTRISERSKTLNPILSSYKGWRCGAYTGCIKKGKSPYVLAEAIPDKEAALV